MSDRTLTRYQPRQAEPATYHLKKLQRAIREEANQVLEAGLYLNYNLFATEFFIKHALWVRDMIEGVVYEEMCEEGDDDEG